jgi:Family of unknown function (DUF6312)
MNDASMVRRIVVVGSDGQGRLLYERETRKRKKGSPGLRQVEKLIRRGIKATQTGSDRYLERHQRSNEKRRDGWLRDLALNVAKANRKGVKVLTR